MNLHFYTKFEYAQKLQQNEKIQVWTKSEAVKTDVHISLNTEYYTIERVSDSDHIFKVSKNYRIF